jgi:hypothetical protein
MGSLNLAPGSSLVRLPDLLSDQTFDLSMMVFYQLHDHISADFLSTCFPMKAMLATAWFDPMVFALRPQSCRSREPERRPVVWGQTPVSPRPL